MTDELHDDQHTLDADGACITCDTKAGVTDNTRLPAETVPLTDTGTMSGPHTYTKVLVTVTAMQYQPDSFHALQDWLGAERLYAPVPEQNVPARVWVASDDTPSSWIALHPSDWLIQDDGDICVLPDETFRRRYRRVVQTEMTVDVVVVEPADQARK